MSYLTKHTTPWGAWPINYVGNMTVIESDLFQILNHFWWSQNNTISEVDARKVFDKAYSQGRDRHSNAYISGQEHHERHGIITGKALLKYDLEIDDLSDDDVRKVCELYWMDYLCIPFEIPKACNLTDLILRHYGEDVEYGECWEYRTREWDPQFVEQYLNQDLNKKPNAKRGGHRKARISHNKGTKLKAKKGKPPITKSDHSITKSDSSISGSIAKYLGF